MLCVIVKVSANNLLEVFWLINFAASQVSQNFISLTFQILSQVGSSGLFGRISTPKFVILKIKDGSCGGEERSGSERHLPNKGNLARMHVKMCQFER